MFGGEEENVSVEFDASLAGVVIDRFGMDVFMQKINESAFRANLRVAVSYQFFSWIMKFGNKARIVSPESVVEKFKTLTGEIMDKYN